MIRQFILLFSLLLSFALTSVAQKQTEFEGVVKYTHTVTAKEESYDANDDYSAIGKHSSFYYKKGNYNWINDDESAYLKMDRYMHADKKVYFRTSFSDTILWMDTETEDLQVVDYKIKKAVLSIAGYTCDELELKLKPMGKDGPISYRRFYYAPEFYANPEHFKGSKRNCTEFIYGHTHSIALRIEFEWPNKIVTWEVTSIEKKKVDDTMFKLDKKAPLKGLF